MFKWLRENDQYKSWIVLNFAISFMICIFAPIDAYYANQDEYWFTLGQMLSVSVIIFFIMFLVLCFVSWGISKTKVGEVSFSVFTCLFVYLYIQGNYIPRSYGVLNGTDIDWNSYTGYAAASIAVGLICAFICILSVLKFRNYIYKAGKTLGVFIVLIQLITISTLMIQNGLSEKRTSMITTNKDYFNLSDENNVIVFLLDTYDANDLNYLLENDYDNQADIFRNFTFYEDTLGAYPTTKCALPYILTGKWYENKQPYIDYVAESYVGNEIYQAFEDNGFEIDMYTKSLYLGSADLYENVSDGKYYIKNRLSFAQALYKLVAFNYLPHQLKQFFFVDTESFSDLKKSDTDYPPYTSNNITVFNKFNEEGLTVSKSGNVFKFYHLDGVHGPYTFDDNLCEDDGDYTSYDEALGNNEYLRRYFEALKGYGLYDSSTIVILADHGHIEYSQNPIFLIKNANEKHDFAVSDAEMSWEYLSDIWVALANGQTVDESFIKSCEPEYGLRRYLFYSWDDAWSRAYMPGMEEMFCDGKALIENLLASGQTYYAENEDHSYTLGETLEFANGRSGYSYCLYGISYGNVRQDALMKFDIKENFQNLNVEITLNDNCGDGVVTVYANDNIVAEASYSSGDSIIDFIIPHDYVDDGILSLELTQGEGESQKEKFTGTNLNISELKIISTDEECNINSQCNAYKYLLGENIGFTKDNPSGARYMRSGFSSIENWGTWTSGDKAILRFRATGIERDLELLLEYSTFDGEQNVQVYVNDKVLTSFIAQGIEQKVIEIPSGYLTDDYIDIKFVLPDAHSPASIDNKNTDNRELALGFISASLREKEMYEYGDVVEFRNEGNNAEKYIVSGFSSAESGGTWTDGTSAELEFPLHYQSGTDLNLNLNYSVYHGTQHVIVYANGIKVDDYDASGEESKNITIPASVITDNKLSIRFELNDASSPADNGESEDGRKLALSVKNMAITEKPI